MKEKDEMYRSYLLRLWQITQDDHFSWRASLENTKTGDRQAFESLDDFFNHVQKLTGQKRDRKEKTS